MAFRFKDDLEETRSNLVYLDYSELLVFTKSELDKALARLPDLRLKPDPLDAKLVSNEPQTQAGVSYFRSPRKSILAPPSASLQVPSSASLQVPSSASLSNLRSISSSASSSRCAKHHFADPVPPSMRHLNLNDFCGTEINWKMLTLSRPPTKLEEDYFSQLVKLYQLRHKTKIEDGHGFRKAVFRLSRHPRVLQYKPVNFAFDSFGFKCNEDRKSILIKEDTSYDAYARIPSETESNQHNEYNLTAAAEMLSSGETFDIKLFSNIKNESS